MSKAIRVAIATAILASGVAIFNYLVSTKPAAKKSVQNNEGVAVEVVTIEDTSTRVTVRARGTVMPARQVVLGTEVGGKVIKISPELQPGGKFKKGEIIAQIDPADYRLALEQQFAMVDSAQAQLSIEESRRNVAKREWEMFGSKRKDTANKQLALREPQLRSATTQLKSAKSSLKRARLSVERTLLRAPFDGMVQTRNVDLGQIVAPGAPLLSFVGTQSYWVQVALPVERLAWIAIPDVNDQVEGANAWVRHRVGEEHIERRGKVLRLLSEVDPAGRMARVLIEIQDPLGLATIHTEETVAKAELPKPKNSALPMLLGTYVEVEIEGRPAENIVELRRSALREGNKVYLMTADKTLEKREVKVLWRREKTVLLTSGLKVGEIAVVSPLAAAVEGMKLRLPGSQDPADQAASAEVASEASPTGAEGLAADDTVEKTVPKTTQKPAEPATAKVQSANEDSKPL